MSKKFKAVIWDMDGVIADTAPYHLKAWQDVFLKHKAEYSEIAFRENFGKRNDAIIKNIMGADIPVAEIDTIAKEKEENFRRSATGILKALPGVIKLIKSLDEAGFSQALGSSAPIENVELIIREVGLAGFFKVIVSGRDVKEGKPSPLGFLLAAEKLNITPQNCIVIEDAIAGVAAAKNAGMKCLAVTNTNTASSLNAADMVVDTLEEVTPEDILNILNKA